MAGLKFKRSTRLLVAAILAAFCSGWLGVSLGFYITNSGLPPYALTVGTGFAMSIFTASNILVLQALIKTILGDLGRQLKEFQAVAQKAVSLRPEFEDAAGWVQPEREEGDELLEADMVLSDGTETRLIVLVKPDGRVLGFSGPMVGHGLHLRLGPPDNLPEPPS